MKRSEFVKYLNENDCQLYREGSKHTVFINISTNKRVTLPRHNEIHNNFCKDICKQLGIPIIRK